MIHKESNNTDKENHKKGKSARQKIQRLGSKDESMEKKKRGNNGEYFFVPSEKECTLNKCY
jgi:hypothetical protein